MACMFIELSTVTSTTKPCPQCHIFYLVSEHKPVFFFIQQSHKKKLKQIMWSCFPFFFFLSFSPKTNNQKNTNKTTMKTAVEGFLFTSLPFTNHYILEHCLVESLINFSSLQWWENARRTLQIKFIQMSSVWISYWKPWVNSSASQFWSFRKYSVNMQCFGTSFSQFWSQAKSQNGRRIHFSNFILVIWMGFNPRASSDWSRFKFAASCSDWPFSLVS